MRIHWYALCTSPPSISFKKIEDLSRSVLDVWGVNQTQILYGAWSDDASFRLGQATL